MASDILPFEVVVDNEKTDAEYVTELLEETLAEIRAGTLKPLDVAMVLVERVDANRVHYCRRTTANIGSELNLYQLGAFNTMREIMEDD